MAGNKAEAEAEAEAEVKKVPNIRDQIREQVFGAKAESEVITFFGAEIELRQPELGVILNMREGSTENAAIAMLLDRAYVPGTDEKVFSEDDGPALRKLPLGDDVRKLIEVVNRLAGLDSQTLEDAIKDAEKSATQGSDEDHDDVGSEGTGEG